MSNSTIHASLNISARAAPQLLGSFFNWALYGMLVIQTYIFHISFPKDPLSSKLIVYSVFLIESLQTTLVAHASYGYFASEFGNLDNLDEVHLQWLAVPVITGIVSCTVQLYYAYRIWLISHSRPIAVSISALSLLQASCAIAEGVRFFQVGLFSELASVTSVTSSIWLSGSALCDVLVAGAMTYILHRHDSGLPRTHVMITRIIHVMIATGALTAVATILNLALFLALPHTAYYTSIAIPLAKFYSNSLMVVQNSRMRVVGGRNRSPAHTFEIGLEDLRPESLRFGPISPSTTASAGDTEGRTRVHGQLVRMEDARDEVTQEEPVKKSHDLATE